MLFATCVCLKVLYLNCQANDPSSSSTAGLRCFCPIKRKFLHRRHNRRELICRKRHCQIRRDRCLTIGPCAQCATALGFQDETRKSQRAQGRRNYSMQHRFRLPQTTTRPRSSPSQDASILGPSVYPVIQTLERAGEGRGMR
jgi:hypothetical protein